MQTSDTRVTAPLRKSANHVNGHCPILVMPDQGEHACLIAESLSRPVTRCSKRLRYLWVNQAYAEWLRRPREKIIGARIIDIIGQPAMTALKPYFQKVLSGNRVEYEERILFRGLGPRLIHTTYTPTRDETGATDGWVAEILDIEDRRRAHVFLQRTQNLQTIAAQLVQAGTIEELTQVFAKSQRAALGAGACVLYELETGSLRLVGDGGLPQSLRNERATIPLTAPLPLADAVRNRAPVWLSTREAILQLYPHLETSMMAPELQAIASLPLLFEDRCIGGLSISFREARAFDEEERAYLIAIANLWAQALRRARQVEAERKALRRGMDRSERLYRLTAALASTRTVKEAVEVFAAKAPEVVESQSAVVYGVSPDKSSLEMIAKHGPRNDLRPHASVPLETGLPICRVVRDRQPRLYPTKDSAFEEFPDQRAVFQDHPSEAWAMFPLINPSGEAMGGVSYSFRDPTEFTDDRKKLLIAVTDHCAIAMDRARAYDAEAEALRKKDEFLAMLGHELRNPLSPMVVALDLMRRRHITGADKERAIIERQVQHLVRLVDDLLDVSRIASGKIALKREPVELFPIVSTAVEIASPLLEERRHQLRIDVAVQGLIVNGDGDRLAQVVANLLMNAAKFTEPVGSILVEAAHEGTEIVLRVRDSGAGMDADMVPKVFELFSQGKQASNRAQGGLGLGLAIVKNLITLHGGSVSAYSAGRGHGSTFSVQLPCFGTSASRSNRPMPGPDGSPRSCGQRILIVDDNSDAADILADLLENAGHTTCVAYDGPQALRSAATFAADIALLDIGLPVMDGYELARRLRQLPGFAALHLIAITGYGQDRDREASLEAGFDEHLVKPIDLERLHGLIGGFVPVALKLAR